MISDDEYLERIVAGIQRITTEGADVTWNEKIGGRQFDVVVRFKLGTLRYLVLIEVKNQTRKASVSDLEAFVLKAHDHGANKVVFVTAAGFQSGAIEIAKRHGVDLFVVTFDQENLHLSEKQSRIILTKKGVPKNVPKIIEIGEPTLVANIVDITLEYNNGKRSKMPNEPSQMTYYAAKTNLEDGRSINELLHQAEFKEVVLGKTQKEKIHVVPPQKISPPDNYFFPSGTLKSMICSVKGQMGQPIRGNTRIDPGAFTHPIVYTNAFTGEALRMTLDQLPLGNIRVEQGSFYLQPHPLIYYYCEAVDGDIVRWNAIESFQNGELISFAFTQNIKFSHYYIPVTDKTTVKRLKKRLKDYRQLPRRS